jgi:amino acid adenylation domain-containing protein
MPDFSSLVIDYNRTAAEYPTDATISRLIEEQVDRTPDAEAIRSRERALTYRDLDERANQVAAQLRSLGVAPNQFVTICMRHSVEVVCAILGVLKTGAAYVPVDPSIPKARLARILDQIAGVQGSTPIVISQHELRERLPGNAAPLLLDTELSQVRTQPTSRISSDTTPSSLAYVIFTSGSTGEPKGVMIEHRSLVNYAWWARSTYSGEERLAWPLFSSLAFDLTVTSIFTPLISGGRIVVYGEQGDTHGAVVFDVIADNAVDIMKLTPAHLAMLKDASLAGTRIRKFILGGEDLKTELAAEVTRRIGRPVEIFNEYGPTEATVGCMIHRYDAARDLARSVPIGVPAANAGVYVLDDQLLPVPPGTTGEMYVAGDGLARGYFSRPDLTDERFILAPDPRERHGWETGTQPLGTLRLYKTGDLARWQSTGQLEFLGRADEQVSIGGARVELGEVEARLLEHVAIQQCAVVLKNGGRTAPTEIRFCARCGLASTFPDVSYDAEGVCSVCRGYDRYAATAEAYFKPKEELEALVRTIKAARSGDYDALVLYSGGKDSTYMLARLHELGLKPLAFFLDNGFISDEAKANIRHVVERLGVDLEVGRTPHMNEIFVDSLKRSANVCNGCFKTIYTLATNLAHAKGIRYVFTGLSRGQFFETRLTEEVFRREDFDVAKLDALILEARKAYHQREDAVSCHLPVDIPRDEGVLDEIHFVDFYRYWSTPLDEMYAYLRERVGWNRPTDTGRSTNCRINDLGIYIHKKQRGFHNYALPYSWDVRLGQKTREEAMAELDDTIDEKSVHRMMEEIGYREPAIIDDAGISQLIAYYVSASPIAIADLRRHLGQTLPEYMLPSHFVRLDALPLTTNGKVDRRALPAPTSENSESERQRVAPRTDDEKALARIWSELLKVETIGVDDEFFALGGHSLLAIRALSRIRDQFGVEIPLQAMFAQPTIAGLAQALETARAAAARAPGARRPSAGAPITRQARRPVQRPPGELTT